MIQVEHISELREQVAMRKPHGLVGFVPTMGYFHEGHLSLMRQARAECGYCVVSLFVNPAQFGPREDFSRYPRDLTRDAALAQEAGCDVLFVPSTAEMYPQSSQTWVEPGALAEPMEGALRPGHFRGVATVVLKLFHIVQAHRAYFGRKDFQQLRVIQQMVADLNVPIEVVPCETVREADGLAMSSRNLYLSAAERAAAPAIYRALTAVREAVVSGTDLCTPDGMALRVVAELDAHPLIRTQYASIVRERDLRAAEDWSEPTVLAVAALVGNTRLIDNIQLPARR